MINQIYKNCLFVFILASLVLMAGCGNSEEKIKVTENKVVAASQPPATPAPAVPASSAAPATGTPPAASADQPDTSKIAVSVDKKILSKAALEKDMKERFNSLKGKLPKDQIKEIRKNMKQQIVEEFIVRTVLANEVEKRKIQANAKEIKETTDQIQANLPPDQKLDAFMKENKITREDIALGIKIRKMVMQDLGKNAQPTEEEIAKYYNENQDKFIIPETAHVRHILVAFAQGDDDKIKAEKKLKIENLRKQVVDGTDFAEVARKNSDCPSKEKGGDLGLIGKGQTVKPFEDAAFSQEINVVGPIVATDFGYHVVQVLARNVQKAIALDEAKINISPFLEQQKQTDAFNALFKKLRANAKIIIYDK